MHFFWRRDMKILINLPKIKSLIKGGTEIQTQAAWARAYIFNDSLYTLSKGQSFLHPEGLPGLFHLIACRHFRGLAGVKQDHTINRQSQTKPRITSWLLPLVSRWSVISHHRGVCHVTPWKLYFQILRLSLDHKEVIWAKWRFENSCRKYIPFVRWFSE